MSVRLLQSVFCLQGETWHWCCLCTGLHTFGSAVWNGRKHNGRSSQNRSDSDSGHVSCWFHFHLEVEDFFNGLELLSQIFSAITAKKYFFVVLSCSFFTSKLHCLKVVFIHQMAIICGLTCGLLELWPIPTIDWCPKWWCLDIQPAILGGIPGIHTYLWGCSHQPWGIDNYWYPILL